MGTDVVLTEAHSATNVNWASRRTVTVTADTHISQQRFLVGI